MGIFMTLLRTSESISSKAIEFLVLTAVRSGSVRKAKWSEIDFKQKVWNIPAENTKTYKFHRVPLSDQAIFLLKKLNKVVGIDYIFPSPTGKSLSDMALSQFMRGMYERGEMSSPAVPHGHRSSFRDWAAEQTNFPDELRKIASQHKVGDAVKEAYQRTDLLEKRRNLMQEWADFLDQVNINKQNAISFLKI
jgi:integrase